MFTHDEYDPLKADAVIVDEVSMVDVPLMAALMAALRLDPLSLKALDDLRGQVLNDMKGEELSEALTAYGASLEHNLSSSAMNRMPASKIVNSSTN